MFDEEYDGTDGDQWLKKYTYDGVGIAPEQNVLVDLTARFPYEGGTLYRGLNFRSADHLERFMMETNNGTELLTGGISSWTKEAETALNFAVTRPTYHLSHDLMAAEHLKKRTRDYMIGHAGVIIKISIEPGRAIDVAKTRHDKENEVILPPGKYKIELHQMLQPFMQSITDDNFGAHLMGISSITKSTEDAKKFDHIVHRFTDYNDTMRAHLFKLICDRPAPIETQVTVGTNNDHVTSNYRDKIPHIYPKNARKARSFRSGMNSAEAGGFQAVDVDVGVAYIV